MLALEEGSYTMNDGTVIEVGSYPLGGVGQFEQMFFNRNFASTPHIFLSIQTYNGSDTVTVRAKDINNQGFTSALFEQESLMNGDHASERVSYIAIVPGVGLSGVFDSSNGPVNYTLYSQSLTSGASPIGGEELYFLQEEQSADEEVSHTSETIQMLDIGGVSIVQQVTSNGADTTSIRRQ